MMYPIQEVSTYELEEFVKKYDSKTIELNVFQLEGYYSKLEKSEKISFKKYLEYHESIVSSISPRLYFNGIRVKLI